MNNYSLKLHNDSESTEIGPLREDSGKRRLLLAGFLVIVVGLLGGSI